MVAAVCVAGDRCSAALPRHSAGHGRMDKGGGDRLTAYGRKWQRMRALYLQTYPLCVMCQSLGQVVQANVVDHKRAHKGDPGLFWDRANWQALCYSHHNSVKQSEDRTGVLTITARGCDVNGYPLEKSHRWNNSK